MFICKTTCFAGGRLWKKGEKSSHKINSHFVAMNEASAEVQAAAREKEANPTGNLSDESLAAMDYETLRDLAITMRDQMENEGRDKEEIKITDRSAAGLTKYIQKHRPKE